jgi:hypothetical protein
MSVYLVALACGLGDGTQSLLPLQRRAKTSILATHVGGGKGNWQWKSTSRKVSQSCSAIETGRTSNGKD